MPISSLCMRRQQGNLGSASHPSFQISLNPHFPNVSRLLALPHVNSDVLPNHLRDLGIVLVEAAPDHDVIRDLTGRERAVGDPQRASDEPHDLTSEGRVQRRYCRFLISHTSAAGSKMRIALSMASSAVTSFRSSP